MSNNEYFNIIETLVSIFTIDKGSLKILLMKKQSEPYRNYWILPGDILSKQETAEENIKNAIYDKMGLSEIYLEQCQTYTNPTRDPEERIIALTYLGLVDNTLVQFKREKREEYITEWFPIEELPKIAYDHEEIINTSIKHLRKKIVNSNILKILFPSDFTLPELQRLYEQILGKKLDRRNFRKKFINLGLIEDTGDKNEGAAGRPAKLYRLKEQIEERNLF